MQRTCGPGEASLPARPALPRSALPAPATTGGGARAPRHPLDGSRPAGLQAHAPPPLRTLRPGPCREFDGYNVENLGLATVHNIKVGGQPCRHSVVPPFIPACLRRNPPGQRAQAWLCKGWLPRGVGGLTPTSVPPRPPVNSWGSKPRFSARFSAGPRLARGHDSVHQWLQP